MYKTHIPVIKSATNNKTCNDLNIGYDIKKLKKY
jgi:hypothetical protein